MAYHGNHPMTYNALADRDVKRVLRRHADVEERLHAAMAGVNVNWDDVRQLKAMKLRLADELHKLRHSKDLH